MYYLFTEQREVSEYLQRAPVPDEESLGAEDELAEREGDLDEDTDEGGEPGADMLHGQHEGDHEAAHAAHPSQQPQQPEPLVTPAPAAKCPAIWTPLHYTPVNTVCMILPEEP